MTRRKEEGFLRKSYWTKESEGTFFLRWTKPLTMASKKKELPMTILSNLVDRKNSQNKPQLLGVQPSHIYNPNIGFRSVQIGVVALDCHAQLLPQTQDDSFTSRKPTFAFTHIFRVVPKDFATRLYEFLMTSNLPQKGTYSHTRDRFNSSEMSLERMHPLERILAWRTLVKCLSFHEVWNLGLSQSGKKGLSRSFFFRWGGLIRWHTKTPTVYWSALVIPFYNKLD